SYMDRASLFSWLFQYIMLGFEQSEEMNRTLKRKVRRLRGVLRILGYKWQDVVHCNAVKYFKKAHQILVNHTHDSSKQEKIRLICDLIHMHINRFFTSNQRRKEMILYYCLWKYYHSSLVRENQNS